MTYIIRISADGKVTRCEGKDIGGLANLVFGGEVEIVTLNGNLDYLPFGADDERFLVGAIHDSGAIERFPVNKKAWALYGRSPICGEMFVAADQMETGPRPELPEEWIERITRDDFVPDHMLKVMKDWVDSHKDPIEYVWKD